MIVAALLFSLLVQDPSTPAPSPAPANECKAPDLPERSGLSAEEANRIGDEARVYADCITAYIEARRSALGVRLAEVQAESDAVGAVTTEANEFVARFNTWQSGAIASPAPGNP